MFNCAYLLSVNSKLGVLEFCEDKEDIEFARRIGVLLQEMEAAYNERLDFIRELEPVPGVVAAVKTAEFLNNALWKDERRMQRLWNLRIDTDLIAYEKEKFTEKI
ncbi:hypothetical protein Tco_0247314 [Tanacetum coccineum]